MQTPDLEDRYAQILERFAQEAGLMGKASDRRHAPRIPVASRHLTAAVAEKGVRTDIDVLTKDISMSGVCFYADRPFELGVEIELAVAKVFSLTASVVSCEMEETDSTMLEVRYRVRCQFLDEHHGMELMVIAKEAEMREGRAAD